MGVINRFINPDREFVLGWAWAQLIANGLLILTGGLVRLTGSGLGCPTFPRCTEDSFVPHKALGINGVIEFGNRMLTFVLVVVAIGLLVSVWRWSRSDTFSKGLTAVLAGSVPAQGLLGGITVLTGLNPWVVALHLLWSAAIVSGSVILLMRLRGDTGQPSGHRILIMCTYAALWIAIYLGTIVTGSGPHAGDIDSPRNGLDPATMTQLHADAVFLLLGLTIGAWLALRTSGAAAARIAGILFAVELAQGLIGYIQYFTHLPIVLVAMHMAGAAALAAVGTWLMMSVRFAHQRSVPTAPQTIS